MLSLVDITVFRLESKFPPMRALEFIRDHVTFTLPYDFSYHMKNPDNSKFLWPSKKTWTLAICWERKTATIKLPSSVCFIIMYSHLKVCPLITSSLSVHIKVVNQYALRISTHKYAYIRSNITHTITLGFQVYIDCGKNQRYICPKGLSDRAKINTTKSSLRA